MEIKYFDKEFVERTKNIVQTQCKDDFEYDVTLLLNCMLGLVSLPTERTKPGQNPFKQECVNKLKNMGVIVNSTDVRVGRKRPNSVGRKRPIVAA